MSDNKTFPVYLDAAELDLIALAMDRFINDIAVDSPKASFALNLLILFDILAEEANTALPIDRILDRKDNLLIVDFRPKED